MDDFYNSNKYFEIAFEMKITTTLDIFDQIINVFTKKFHELYGDQRKEASIDVPEKLADLIECNNKFPTTLCILSNKEN